MADIIDRASKYLEQGLSERLASIRGAVAELVGSMRAALDRAA